MTMGAFKRFFLYFVIIFVTKEKCPLLFVLDVMSSSCSVFCLVDVDVEESVASNDSVPATTRYTVPAALAKRSAVC